jgi:hypothetical protein
MSKSTPLVTSTKFPTGAEIYAARYADGLKWSEMRAQFNVSARSSRFLQECVAFVNGDADLLARHPEMSHIDADPVTAEVRATIKAARAAGQGLSILQARTGLKPADLRKIVGEEVGTTSRVAWGQRYSGKLPVADEATEEAAPADAPVKKTRAKKSADADLTAALEASVKAAPRKRAPRKAKAAA